MSSPTAPPTNPPPSSPARATPGTRTACRADPRAAAPPRWPPAKAVLSLGTDTAGSIRQPAAFCGVVGVKPTYGRVSRYGLIAFASSLDCPGPVARDVTDAAMMLQAIAGPDARDSTAAAVPVPRLPGRLGKRRARDAHRAFAGLFPHHLPQPGWHRSTKQPHPG